MSKTIAYAGALATALLVASAGAAAAQEESGGLSSEGLSSSSISGSASSETDTDTDTETGTEGEEGPLGSLGELAPTSVTGSLPGYTTGPIGSTAAVACNIGTVAGWAAQATGVPLPVPVGLICNILNPVARSADSLVAGDVEGSVGAILAGVPLVGNSLADKVDTGSATESVEGSVGDRLGSLAETSVSQEGSSGGAPEGAPAN